MPVHHVGDVAGWLCLKSPEMLLDRDSTVRGSGCVKTFEPHTPREYRTLNLDPPATAGGTDPVQVKVVTFEAKPSRLTSARFRLRL
jgi:hypothetical protein